jgi:ferric-dicitrate binding protein FerR (iron transport regulator)
MNYKENKAEYSTLLKYFEDRASKEEAAIITRWLEDAESGFKCEKCLHLLWNKLDPKAKVTEIDLEALLDKIHHTIHLRSGKQTKVRILSPGRKPAISFNNVLRNLGRIAAIFLVPVMGYIGWEIYSQKMWVKNQAEVTYNEIKCPLGAKSQFELPDGTKGNLNNGSRLRYPVKFTGNTREVELYGEAFFDVHRNRQRPFIINTVGLDVKVLGTRLNVYSYPDERYQEITLESGLVELIQREEDQMVTVAEMKPGQHVVYRFGPEGSDYRPKNRDRELIILESKEQIDDLTPRLKPGKQVLCRLQEGDLYLKNDETEQYTGWTEGKLILRNDPMPILLKRMERWYNVKFNIRDERINEYTYWATFEEENLDQVLRLLSLTGPVKFNMLPRGKMDDGTYKTQEIDVTIK